MKICKDCFVEKGENEFYLKSKSKNTLDCYCKVCRNKRTSQRHNDLYHNDLKYREKYKAYSNSRSKIGRASEENRDKYIAQDSKKKDIIKGRANDIDRQFIAKLISEPCVYCGDTDSRMTLDRLDNAIGHLKTNVVPSCVRCNYTRGQMPIEAWNIVAEGMKKAREAGLFGEWTGDVRRSGK